VLDVEDVALGEHGSKREEGGREGAHG
jgi:hypothetical protein